MRNGYGRMVLLVEAQGVLCEVRTEYHVDLF